MKKSDRKNNPSSTAVDECELALVFIESIDAQLRLLQGSIAKAGEDYAELIQGRINEKLDERGKWMKIRDAH